MQVYPLVFLWEVNITLVNGFVLIRPGIHQGPRQDAECKIGKSAFTHQPYAHSWRIPSTIIVT